MNKILDNYLLASVKQIESNYQFILKDTIYSLILDNIS